MEDGEYAPRNYHWRAWFAVAVVLVFVGLGWLEWRAQVNQTDNGPVEVIRTKLRKLHGAVVQMTSDSSTAGNDSAKPDMQVQEQPQAQAPVQPNPNGVTGAANAPPQPADQSANHAETANAQSSPPPSNAVSTAAPESSPDASTKTPNVTAKKPATDNTAQQTVAAAKPPAKRAPDKTSDADDAAAKAAPGADEMTKAKNASDSAAEAAWLWKATAKGNADAPVQLADMYIQGDGVPRSCEQAVVLLKTAAEKENARARNRLASMYASGTCVQRNRVEAYRWLSSALTANPNSEWAQQNRDLIWQQMTPEERAAAQKYR